MQLTGVHLPTPPILWRALLDAGHALGIMRVWCHNRRFHFRLDHGWSVALSADTADRIRVDLCRWTEPRDTKWVRADDRATLRRAVLEAAEGLVMVDG